MAFTEPGPRLPFHPDVLNKSSFNETLPDGEQKRLEEPDTCRICRGEGSKEEPLFYPCKCSGSIKFVHQGCLMEWLSHSQKKHCELCKTSFHFTKLYDPNMPKTVPMPIFLRQAALHILKSVLTWARWNVVFFVWLGWVPWCMRTVWRALFWIGDGGWVNLEELQTQSAKIGQEHLNKMAAGGAMNMSNLIIHKNFTAFQIISKVTSGMPRIWRTALQTSNSTSQPAVFRFAKSLFKIVFHRGANGVSVDGNNSFNNATISTWPDSGRSSLLSDVDFLRTLTPWAVVNRLIIDVIEGQLITLFVVIAFILIFLIREWVVQQQPAINMGEAREAPGRFDMEEALNDALNPAAVAGGQQIEAQGPRDADQRPELGPHANRIDDRRIAVPRARGVGHRRAEPIREDRQQLEGKKQDSNIHDDAPLSAEYEASGMDGFEHTYLAAEASSAAFAYNSDSNAGPSTPQPRPGLPPKDGLSRAAEIQRNLEENPGWPGLTVFKDLWQRADSKPSEVVKIIQEEGREAELEWVMTAMRALELKASFEIPEASRRKIRSSLDNALGDRYIVQDPISTTEREQGIQDLAEISTVVASAPTEEIITDVLSVWNDNEEDSMMEAPGNDILVNDEPDQNVRNDQNEISVPQSTLPQAVQTYESPGEEPLLINLSVAGSNDDQSESQDSTSAATGIILTPNSDSLSVEGTSTQEQTVPYQFNPHTDDPPTINNAEGFKETVFNWLWGDTLLSDPQVEFIGEVGETIVQELVEEAPFPPALEDELITPDGDVLDVAVPELQVAEAAAEAGADPNDAEAVEDGEDLEGVMELIGMQGPIAGLLQNGMFCAVLISITVFCGIWIPYIAGKVLLVLLANPISLLVKLPLRWASTIADVVIDTSVVLGASFVYWVAAIIRLVATPAGWILPFFATINNNKFLSTAAWTQASIAGDRLLKMFVTTSESFSDSDIPVFSIIAHESLTKAEQYVVNFTAGLVSVGSVLLTGQAPNSIEFSYYFWYDSFQIIVGGFSDGIHSITFCVYEIWHMLPALLTVNPLRIALDIPQRQEPLDYNLAIWNTRDRVLTIILGYIAFALLGTFYIKIRLALQEDNDSQRARGVVADVLYQAAGVLKVVLIISIEMLVFPLYCGMLLDAALLPLFENATISSRIIFTLKSPITSLFVHWFVGTCYMFHFALFVSMCRKIMRHGVLYFIRDPDDPTFHPVRDVLERNVATQLRKITFSALVYGALVIVCLGSVVWGLNFAFDAIFPIHWSSNEPVLEFPVDLLVYNFLMPLALKFFRPSKGLNEMYEWWFRKCARLLRLSHFLFGEEKADEEGHRPYPIWTKLIHHATPKLVVRTDNKTISKAVNGNATETSTESTRLPNDLVPDGRYVRTPASDQVRIPKGATTFVEVDKAGNRKDGKPDNIDGLHGSNNNLFTVVYIPPHFRFRIALFILLIWIFAATTGVTFTIIPLLVGRRVFANLIPTHLRMNDVYAFSIGVYLLGGPLYIVISYRKPLATFTKNLLRRAQAHPDHVIISFLRDTLHILLRIIRLAYFYTSFTILLPSIFALLMEAYVVIPLHTYFSPPAASAQHTIHFIQDWTLGVLYLKMATRLVLYRPHTRPATALRAIVAAPYGWLDPDIRLATRAAILPGTIFGICALLAPLGLGAMINKTIPFAQNDFIKMCVYRYTYPALAALGFCIWGLFKIQEGLRIWRTKIRDEVYLIGERLHNFGERRKRRRKVDKGKMREGIMT